MKRKNADGDPLPDCGPQATRWNMAQLKEIRVKLGEARVLLEDLETWLGEMLRRQEGMR